MIKNDKQNQNLGLKVLKIYKKYFKRLGYYAILPEIRLGGKWLQNLGFNYGENVIIISEENRLLIRNSEKVKVIL